METGFAGVGQKRVQFPGCQVVRGSIEVGDDKSGQKECSRFHIIRIDTVISDLCSGKRDELPGVGRIGNDFLIASHAGIENDFTDSVDSRCARYAREQGPVCQSQIMLHNVLEVGRCNGGGILLEKGMLFQFCIS